MHRPEFFAEETTPIQTYLTNLEPENNPQVIQRASQISSRILNKEMCILCKQPFDLGARMPRVAVQCGHTFCTVCVSSCIRNQKFKCPQCLSVLNGVTNPDKLPVNTSIFTVLCFREKVDQKLLNLEKELENECMHGHNHSRQVSHITQGVM